MNRYQKLAWFNLIVIVVTIITTSTAIALELHLRGHSEIGFWFLGLLALLRFKSFLFKKPQGQDTVVCDERDILIVKKALSISYTIFWFVFIVSCFGVHVFMGMEPNSSVPTITLPLMAIAGALLMKIVCSAAILVQYGRGGQDG